MRPSTQLKQIIQTEHSIVKNPNWPDANQLAINLQAWPRILTRGYRETNPGSCKNGTWTRDRRIESPTRWLLGHATSYLIVCKIPNKRRQLWISFCVYVCNGLCFVDALVKVETCVWRRKLCLFWDRLGHYIGIPKWYPKVADQRVIEHK